MLIFNIANGALHQPIAEPNGLVCEPIAQLYNNWPALADNPTLTYRGASMIIHLLLQGRQNTTLKWFKQCPASFALKSPEEDMPWLQTIPVPIFQLLNLISDDALQQINNQEANNFQQSFPNLKRLSKFRQQTSMPPTNASNSFVLSPMGVSLRRNL